MSHFKSSLIALVILGMFIFFSEQAVSPFTMQKIVNIEFQCVKKCEVQIRYKIKSTQRE